MPSLVPTISRIDRGSGSPGTNGSKAPVGNGKKAEKKAKKEPELNLAWYGVLQSGMSKAAVRIVDR